MAIVHTMKEAFANAGVLELMQRDLDVVKYTGLGDPFRIDFGYRWGRGEDVPWGFGRWQLWIRRWPLAYRYSRIEAGMRREHLQASLTAVVDREMALQEEKTRFAIGMLKQGSVRVKKVGEMADIAARCDGICGRELEESGVR